MSALVVAFKGLLSAVSANSGKVGFVAGAAAVLAAKYFGGISFF